MRWIVAATGASLTPEIAEQCRGHNVIAVNDAYKLFPFAKAMYAADGDWWILHKGCPEFTGRKWTTIGETVKNPAVDKYGLGVVIGRNGYGLGFDFNPGHIHWCGNSGFQAVNLALNEYGATTVVLIGFDMHGTHFFGEHPQLPRRATSKRRFEAWVKHFEDANRLLPDHIRIINATEGSALKCFPMMSLSEALNG